ncbi:MAG: hypothetical protein KAH84_09800 [Thiomargarita sp.]|nr:hypothetical protein [Bacteroidales bacterium]MCK5720225.1 hypothetical protein [Thiomargarita sp.]
MFKTFIKVGILFFLLVINISLFTWIVNYISLEFSPLKSIVFNELQAKSITTIPINKPIKKLAINIKNTYNIPIESDNLKQQFMVQFELKNTYLSKNEQNKIEKVLQNLKINSSYSIKILSNVATSDKEHSNFLMITKLRIQSVARVIYPYTQNIKMYYHFPVENDKVMIRIFQP